MATEVQQQTPAAAETVVRDADEFSAMLQQSLKLPGRANLLLAAPEEGPSVAMEAYAAVRQTWQLADAQLELRELPDLNQVELRTSRVFLDPPVVRAAAEAAPVLSISTARIPNWSRRWSRRRAFFRRVYPAATPPNIITG